MLPSKYDDNVAEERKKEFKRQQDRLKMMAPDTERKAVSADAMIDSLLQKSDTFRRVNNDLPAWLKVDSPHRCPFYEKIWELVRATDQLADTPRISHILLTSGLHPDMLGYIWNMANKTKPGHLTKQELFMVLALVGLAQSGCSFSNILVLDTLPTAPQTKLHLPFQMGFPHQAVASSPTLSQPQKTNSTFSNLVPPPYQHGGQPPDPAGQQITPVIVNPSVVNTNPVGYNIGASISTPLDNSAVGNPLSCTLDQNAGSLGEQLDDDFQDFQFVASSTDSGNFMSPPVQPLTPQLPLNTFTANQIKTSTILPAKEVEAFNPSHLSTTPAASNMTPLATFPSDLAKSATSDENDDFADFQSADAFDTSIVQPTAISLPKLSSFIKVSPESERRLRNIAQPEKLTSLPESKISSRNLVSSMPSIAVVGASRSVGSRLANHSLSKQTSSKPEKNHLKHVKLKPIISGSVPLSVEDAFQKCMPKTSTFLLKETKIPSSDIDTDLDIPDHENTRRIEIPSVGTFKETMLPADMKSSIDKAESDTNSEAFLQMDDDKYGALRELEFVTEAANTSADFGEFLSADLQNEKSVEAWTTWNSSVMEAPIESVDDTNLINDSFDMALADMSFPTNEAAATDSSTDVFKDGKVTEIPSGSSQTFGALDLLSDSFDTALSTLNLSTAIAPPSQNLCLNLDVPVKVESTNLDTKDDFGDFGDFVTPATETAPVVLTYEGPTTPPPLEDNTSLHSSNTPSFELNLHGSWSSLEAVDQTSRKGSIHRLDLQIKPEPFQITSRCLECCHSLIKEAVEIFNGVSDRTILREVLDTQQARNYIKYLSIVHAIASRINMNGGGSKLLYEEISSYWLQLDALATEFEIPYNDEEPDANEDLQPCAVCKGKTTDSDIEQDGNRFHASCANLWINCIENSLPCF